MASLDEEEEVVPACVTNFYIVNEEDEPISFSALPLQFGDDERPEDLNKRIFLCGTADDGLRPFFKEVIAWKFELSYVLPEIYVLSKEKVWIKLYKPRESYKVIIKTVLVAVYYLHFVKRHPEGSGEDMWNKIKKPFSTFEVLPSETDLLQHMPLIKKAAQRDKDIANSKYLATLFLEKPGERKDCFEKNHSPKRSRFIVENGDGESDDEDGNGSELFDHVCAYCDDGGEVLSCEGRCIRSFHPTVDSGSNTFCESLGYSRDRVEATPTFLCENCRYQLHQCFACGMLGSSDRSSSAEVFPCISATCGHFYHARCVAELLYPSDKIQAEKFQNKIVSGESFLCPVHQCYRCKQGEDKKIYELQFAICRRCPKAYHRKCLPRTIAFRPDAARNVEVRAWNDLLPNRILIYCMDHKIIPEIGTPRRDHILFPDVDGRKQQRTSGLLSTNKELASFTRSKSHGTLTPKTVIKLKRPFEAIHGNVKVGASIKKTDKGLYKIISQPVAHKSLNPSTFDKSKSSLRSDEPKAFLSMRKNTKQESVPNDCVQKTLQANIVMRQANVTWSSQYAQMEKRIEALMENAKSSFNLEELIESNKMKCIGAYSQKFVAAKDLTLGKVELSVEAVRAALKKLEEGCTIEEAKSVCEPEILKNIIRWKRKLRVYLAPFLHGMRYTSFGRHFTKLDKLKEVVKRLHWYVQDGDTIVDFSCGSNDFSCLMREELDRLGKSCLFKNYDLIQPKKDFNFEKRDWMTVNIGELPPGSNLIIGLNPPFGVQASLANKFIDKALTFNPKLLILIVPKETERLDKKRCPYDLIWEDDALLSGKAFYLPGSLDTNAQQMEQHNLETPPLSLWSRRDWTARHHAVARDHGHISTEQGGGIHWKANDHQTVSNYLMEEKHWKANDHQTVSNYLMEEKHDCYGDFSNFVVEYADIGKLLDDIPKVSDEALV